MPKAKSKRDLRSPMAKARDAWFDSDEGKQCCAGIASGQYLKNRLEIAFFAGAGVSWASAHLVIKKKP